MPRVPYLTLCLSRSPLLTDATRYIPTELHLTKHWQDTTATRDLISALFTRSTLNNLHLHQLHERKPPQNDPQDTTFGPPPYQPLLAVPILQSSTETNKLLDHPVFPHASSISRHEIMSLLDLLDSLNADVTDEVSRVTNRIKEAHSLIDTYKIECEEHRRKSSKGERGIQEIEPADSDFQERTRLHWYDNDRMTIA